MSHIDHAEWDTEPAAVGRPRPLAAEVLVQLMRVVALFVFAAGLGAAWWLHPHDAEPGALDAALAEGRVASYSIGREDDDNEGRWITAARRSYGDARTVFWRDSRGVLWKVPSPPSPDSSSPEDPLGEGFSDEDFYDDEGILEGDSVDGGKEDAGPATAAHVGELSTQLRAAGVPRERLDRGWAYRLDSASGIAGVLSVLILVFAAQPRRATKWAWFWLMLIPGSIGDIVWLLREAPWSRRMSAVPAPLPHHRQVYRAGGDSRLTGGAGFLVFVLAAMILVLLGSWLDAELTHGWRWW